MSRALVFFAHGSRDPAWAESVEQLARITVERDPALRVRIAYLELMQPDLASVLDELATDCTHVAILPVFWSAGAHVRSDLARMLDAAATRHAGTRFDALPTLSELPGLLPFISDAAARMALGG